MRCLENFETPLYTYICECLLSLYTALYEDKMITLLEPHPPTRPILDAFITRHQYLLQLERAAEEEQTRLLNSNCSPRLLEQRGLALGGLGVSNISIGLGGKRFLSCTACMLFTLTSCASLIELCRPLAYHTSSTLPSHTFR